MASGGACGGLHAHPSGQLAFLLALLALHLAPRLTSSLFTQGMGYADVAGLPFVVSTLFSLACFSAICVGLTWTTLVPGWALQRVRAAHALLPLRHLPPGARPALARAGRALLTQRRRVREGASKARGGERREEGCVTERRGADGSGAGGDRVAARGPGRPHLQQAVRPLLLPLPFLLSSSVPLHSSSAPLHSSSSHPSSAPLHSSSAPLHTPPRASSHTLPRGALRRQHARGAGARRRTGPLWRTRGQSAPRTVLSARCCPLPPFPPRPFAPR